MKVVLLADSYLPYLSGVSQSVHRFAEGLVQNGAQVLVIAPNYAHHHDDEMSYEVYRVPSAYLGGYPNFRFAWPFGKKTFQKIQDFKPAVLHAHSPFQMGIAAWMISKRLKIPVVFTHHTLFLDYVHFAPPGLRIISKFILRRYLNGFGNRCRMIVTPTYQIKEYLKKEKIKVPIEVLPTGVWTKNIDAAHSINIRRHHQIPENAFVMLYVGRLSREKNIEFLLETMGDLFEKYSGLYLLIVAGGPLLAELESWVFKHELNGRIIFTGEHPQEVLRDYYLQSNLFVCTSKTETQGIVFAEAGMFGLPVVALGYQGVLNMVQNGINGFTTSENKLEFQSRVTQLLGDTKLLAKLKSSSQKFVLENFDQIKLSRKLLDLYKNVGGAS